MTGRVECCPKPRLTAETRHGIYGYRCQNCRTFTPAANVLTPRDGEDE